MLATVSFSWTRKTPDRPVSTASEPKPSSKGKLCLYCLSCLTSNPIEGSAECLAQEKIFGACSRITQRSVRVSPSALSTSQHQCLSVHLSPQKTQPLLRCPATFSFHEPTLRLTPLSDSPTPNHKCLTERNYGEILKNVIFPHFCLITVTAKKIPDKNTYEQMCFCPEFLAATVNLGFCALS